MIKTFKKAISIFVTAMFVFSLLSTSAFAWTYATSKTTALPFTGDDLPSARMTDSTGTLPVLKGDTANSAAQPVLESIEGVFGKLNSDSVYKTYDLDARKTIDGNTDGDFNVNGFNNRKDRVMEFSFSYEKAGYNPVNTKYANNILVESYFDCYDNYGLTNRLRPSYQMVIRTDCLRFTPSKQGEITSTDAKFDYKPFNFEPNKWYTVTLVFDMENKTAESDTNAASYTHKAYVNGEFVTSYTTSTALYGVRYLRIMPPVGSIMYWDNINYYEIDNAATFTPNDLVANLASANDDIVVSDGQIKLNSLATANDIKEAVSASLKENETVRIYNSDCSEEYANDALVLDGKLVVAGSRILTNDSTAKENIYTYYDIGIDGGYIFDEPTISFDGTKAVGNVKVYNYSGEEKQFKVFLGVYSNNELVGLDISDTNLVAADQSAEEFTTPEADLTNADKVKLFVWNEDGITPEIECVEKSYTIPDEYNPQNADLKSITLPMGTYNANHNGISTLYPAFNKDITEYTVVTYMKTYAGDVPVFETVNSDATVTCTTAPDTSLTNTTAVYTVTSADGTVTKEYKLNYMATRGTTLAITDIRNGYSGSGDCYYTWYRGSNEPLIDADDPTIVIQDGTFNTTRNIKDTRPIIEIDITNGPDEIKYGVLTLAKTQDKNVANVGGTLRLYKINDSIYSAGDITGIAQTAVPGYFGEEICSVSIGLKTGNNADMYYINIGADYYNSLKAADETKMYIGLAGEAADSSKIFCSVFGNGVETSTTYTKSRFHCITE